MGSKLTEKNQGDKTSDKKDCYSKKNRFIFSKHDCQLFEEFNVLHCNSFDQVRVQFKQVMVTCDASK